MTTKIETDNRGTIRYYKDEKLHREDGPAIVWPNGNEYWYHNDQLHREDGPAVICPDGELWWCQFGKLHREDGPAIIYADVHCDWRLNDIAYTFNDWCKALNISDQQKTLLMLKYNIHT